MELWVGCIAGALKDPDYIAKLARAGFEDIDVEPTRVYSGEDARQFLVGEGLDAETHRAAGGRQVHERVCARGETSECAERLLWSVVLPVRRSRPRFC